MASTTTAVQLRRITNPENLWASVPDPFDIDDEEAGRRLSVDIRPADYDLLAQFAAYRNALAAVQGKRLRKLWSRKSMAESMLAIQCDALRHQLREMLTAVGPLPAADDPDEMRRYAKRVSAWDKKLPR